MKIFCKLIQYWLAPPAIVFIATMLLCGESRAEVTVELEGYTVTRSFTAAGGGTLKVTPKVTDGKPIASPQSFLDGLLSTLTFDPFEFTRLKESEQGETLRKLLKLDFSEANLENYSCYNKRTEVNRRVSELSAKLAGTQLVIEDGAVASSTVVTP